MDKSVVDLKDRKHERRLIPQEELERLALLYTGIVALEFEDTMSTAVVVSGGFDEIVQSYIAITEAMIRQVGINPVALGQTLNDYLNFIEGKLPTEYEYDTLDDVKNEIGRSRYIGDAKNLADVLRGISGKEK